MFSFSFLIKQCPGNPPLFIPVEGSAARSPFCPFSPPPATYKGCGGALFSFFPLPEPAAGTWTARSSTSFFALFPQPPQSVPQRFPPHRTVINAEPIACPFLLCPGEFVSSFAQSHMSLLPVSLRGRGRAFSLSVSRRRLRFFFLDQRSCSPAAPFSCRARVTARFLPRQHCFCAAALAHLCASCARQRRPLFSPALGPRRSSFCPLPPQPSPSNKTPQQKIRTNFLSPIF